MSRREDILQNIRRNTRVRYEKPDLSASFTVLSTG